MIVLYVDDNIQSLNLMKKFIPPGITIIAWDLSRSKFDLWFQARDDRQAEKESPSTLIVIIDFEQLDLIREIISDQPQIPIIVLSSRSMLYQKGFFHHLNIFRMLTGPLRYRELIHFFNHPDQKPLDQARG